MLYRKSKPHYFGVDESGSSPMIYVAAYSTDPRDAEKHVGEDGGRLLEKRTDSRFWRSSGDIPEYVMNGGGYARRVVSDGPQTPFLYAAFTNRNRATGKKKPPANLYRTMAIAHLLAAAGVRECDRVYIDAFHSPTITVRNLVETLEELGTRIPEEIFVCEPHADEMYLIVNEADYIANTILHSRSRDFRSHRVRIDLRRNKKAA